MKNQELFNRTISILVKAYQNNVLEYTDCRACAVGNIVAANLGIEIYRNQWGYVDCNDNYTGDWFEPILPGQGKKHIQRDRINTAVQYEINATGYRIDDLAEIEKAFHDGVENMDSSKDYNFNGLMAVVDALMQIHEATTEQAVEAKSLFVK